LVAAVLVSGPVHASTVTHGKLQVCATGSKARWIKYQISRPGFSRTQWLKTRANTRVCAAKLQVRRGDYSVRQVPARGTRVTGLRVSPTSHAVSRVARTTARVSVRSTTATRVTFRNSTKVARKKPSGTKGTGFIEVCKDAGDSGVHGSVMVNITDGATTYSQSVLVGQCTGQIPVPAGTATVSETAPFPYYLAKVTTSPAADLISTNLAASSAKVKVVANTDGSVETLVHLVNKTGTGYFKVCKVLSANSQDIINSGNNTFYFDVTTQRPGLNSVNYGTIAVTVTAVNQPACVLSREIPLDNVVHVTEENAPATALTSIVISPASDDLGSSGRTANFHLGTVRDSVVTATFTNSALGTIEVCKTMTDWTYNGTPFQFEVNGGAPFTVLAGQCSGPISVPAGTATVQELPHANFSLVGFTAVGPDGSNRLLSGTNPIVVSVPYGGVGNETLVTATNKVNTGQFKVCKELDNNVPVGKTYTFTATIKSGGDTYTWSTSLTPTADGPAGEVCSGLSAVYPVVLPDGSGTTVTVTEGPSPFGLTADGKLIVEPTQITYDGNGKETAVHEWQPGDPGAADGTYYISARLGQGVNVFTFLNSLVLDP
jgi:hypothetical protein